MSRRAARVGHLRDGGPPKGDPCEPWGYHGYPGIESKTVSRITDWIKAAK